MYRELKKRGLFRRLNKVVFVRSMAERKADLERTATGKNGRPVRRLWSLIGF